MKKTFTEEDTRYKTLYIGQWCLSPLQVSILGPHTVLPECLPLFKTLQNLLLESPSAALSYFPESHQQSEISALKLKGGFSFRKSQKSKGTKSGLWRGRFTWVIWCLAKKLFTRPDAWAGMLWSWSCQSAVAHSCGLLSHLNSFRKGMFKFNAQYDADSLLYLLSHFKCHGHTVHMLTQWHLLPPQTSRVKSSLLTHTHSRSLSSAARLRQCCTHRSYYINNGWTFSGQISCAWITVYMA